LGLTPFLMIAVLAAVQVSELMAFLFFAVPYLPCSTDPEYFNNRMFRGNPGPEARILFDERCSWEQVENPHDLTFAGSYSGTIAGYHAGGIINVIPAFPSGFLSACLAECPSLTGQELSRVNRLVRDYDRAYNPSAVLNMGARTLGLALRLGLLVLSLSVLLHTQARAYINVRGEGTADRLRGATHRGLNLLARLAHGLSSKIDSASISVRALVDPTVLLPAEEGVILNLERTKELLAQPDFYELLLNPRFRMLSENPAYMEAIHHALEHRNQIWRERLDGLWRIVKATHDKGSDLGLRLGGFFSKQEKQRDVRLKKIAAERSLKVRGKSGLPRKLNTLPWNW
jgi:hypothetical protein